jgi:hypothetical protein
MFSTKDPKEPEMNGCLGMGHPPQRVSLLKVQKGSTFWKRKRAVLPTAFQCGQKNSAPVKHLARTHGAVCGIRKPFICQVKAFEGHPPSTPQPIVGIVPQVYPNRNPYI